MSKPHFLAFILSVFFISSSFLHCANKYVYIDPTNLNEAFELCLELLEEKKLCLDQNDKEKFDELFWTTWDEVGNVLNILQSDNPHLYAIDAAAANAATIVNSTLTDNSKEPLRVWVNYWNRYCQNLYFDPKSIEKSHFFKPCPSKEELKKYLNIYPKLKLLIFVKYFFQASNDEKTLNKVITEAQHLKTMSLKNSGEEIDCGELSAFCIIL